MPDRSRTLVFDIEAVRDEAVWVPPVDKPDAFPPPYAWRPIVIGCVLLDGRNVKRVGAIAVDVATDAAELGLLERFRQTIGSQSSALVTWNGRAYDLPVLMLRSMRHGLDHPWYYQSRDTRYRYTEDGHCDLADAMGDYGATQKLGLDGLARLIGLPGKFGGFDGAGVAAAFEAGRHQEIADYCVADALQTAFLWLRWKLLKGEMALQSYRTIAGELLDAADASPHLPGFSARVDRAVLLMEAPAPPPAVAETAADPAAATG